MGGAREEGEEPKLHYHQKKKTLHIKKISNPSLFLPSFFFPWERV